MYSEASSLHQFRANHTTRLGTHILFLFVGAGRELTTIHSELLPESTKAYINERNVGEQIFQLPNENAEIFRIYRLFLYTGTIYSVTDQDEDRPDNGRRQVHSDAEWMRLAHCYIFALAVKDERFANASIDALIEKMMISDRYPTGIASEVYQWTPAGNNLRSLLVDIHVWKGRGFFVKPPHDDASGPMEFLQDVINELAAAGGKIHEDGVSMPWEDAPCVFYHEHDATAQCPG